MNRLDFRAQLSADWYHAFSIVSNLITIRRVGMQVFDEITAKMLRAHQEHHFLDGLKKLKLDEEPTDAIRCARYHALSNAPGGLNMSYGIESQDKAWVFYNLPYMPDRWSGTSSLIYGPGYYGANMAGWHSNNGALLGNLGLAFVVTHLVARGDPYDGGYFIDTHRELHPSERIRVSFGERPPTDMEVLRPEFDPVEWPPVRLAKVKQRFIVDFASAALLWNVRELGPLLSSQIAELTLRSLLFQTWKDLVDELDLDAPDRRPVEIVGRLFAELHDLAGDKPEVQVSPEAVRVVLGRHWATSTREWEGRPLPSELRGAFERGWAAFARHVEPTMRVEVDESGTTWRFALGDGVTSSAEGVGAVDALTGLQIGGFAS
ncbi:MAG TPA: hypothetical protein VNT55_22780 [Baekduia sp.]|nr:hypothetical protein [Baekduia sp.]